jgi:ADP-ribose pyrophosphatase
MKFKWLASEDVYKGRAFNIRRDLLRAPDERTAWYDIVEHIGSIVIVPVDENGNVYFVKQYRQPAQQILLELPAGTLEPGEDPLECARREIREETGMAAREVQELGSFYLAPGYSTEFMHAYLATGLHPSPLEGDVDEFLENEIIPLPQALTMAKSGQIPDAKSLAALLLAVTHLPPQKG